MPGNASSTHSPSGSGGIAEDRPQCQSTGDHSATTVPKFCRSSSRPRRRLYSFLVVSSVRPTCSRVSQAAGSAARSLPMAGASSTAKMSSLVAVPDSPAMPAPTPPPPLTLAQWGQKRITWGKKHPGKTYIQTLRDDLQYLDWRRARFSSLTPEQKDFCSAGTRCRDRSPRTSTLASIRRRSK